MNNTASATWAMSGGVTARIMATLALLFFILGCSKNVATCLDIRDKGNARINIGYFYDSSELQIIGPVKFARLPAAMTGNPCLVPLQGNTVSGP